MITCYANSGDKGDPAATGASVTVDVKGRYVAIVFCFNFVVFDMIQWH